ncbi:MAG TPA: LamG-like jellyroll fold domain-containing protein [Verrucomicrobiae bacterium]|nr:LamG-like jellyroll fold domain-containing protein [Verrucomicrobiae bacterium]
MNIAVFWGRSTARRLCALAENRVGLCFGFTLALAVVCLWPTEVWGQNFNDAGFTAELVATLPLYGPVGVAWAPDGRMFIWQKNGVVRVLKNGSLLSTPFLDFSSKINTFNDNGMFCVAFDPNFTSNRYLYLTYVYEPGSDPNDNRSRMARLVRVTASATNPDQMAAGSELTLLDNLPVDFGTHSLGTIRFAPDGKFFVGNGDGASPSSLDANAWGAQDLNNVRGKIFRLTRDGKAPGDNPFDDGTDSVRSKVWCYGVRNPYRFSLHPTMLVPYFADVGWNDWEEIDRGVRGGNFGWPCYEGSRAQSGYQGYLSQCAGVSGVTPIYEYAHGSQGTCIVGGDFYTGTQYPDAYRGNYFFGDYSGNFIRRLVLNASGSVASVATFATDAGAPTCIEQGPDGLLYLASFARGQIKRIRFNGPAANASATPTYGYSPLTVSFSSAGSTSGGGGTLTYLWEFGDGARSSLANPSHTYVASGVSSFNAKLTITNSSRLTSSAAVEITIGSVPPTPVIASPADGTEVLPGQTVFYQGSASDAQDGALPAGSLAWTVLLHHNTHVHSFVGGTGFSGSFEAANHGTIGTFSYEIILTATDSSGLSASISAQLPVLADTNGPTVPTDLTAFAASANRVVLSWQPSSDNAAVASYSLQRCRGQGCGDFQPIAAVTQPGYDDAGLIPTNTYRYRVQALDASGNASGYSVIATATTLDGPPVSPSLVAAYSFNEGVGDTVTDVSGHGHVGTLNRVYWSSQGRFGRALSFQGDGMISVNHSPLLALSNAMTLEAWVYPTSPPVGWEDVIFKDRDIYYLMGSSSQGGLPATGGTFTTPLFGNALVPVNTWSHLAATYDSSTLRLYVNGVEVASRPLTTLIRSSTGVLTIGGDPSFGQYWKGLIDEVRIYDEALSVEQIRSDMALPVEISGNGPPVAVVAADPASGVPPLSVAFSSDGSFDPEGATLTYSWSFGDGTFSTEANPNHTYSSTGTFFTHLTVSDGTNSTTTGDLPITVSSANALVAAYGFEEGGGTVTADVSGMDNFGTIRGAVWTSSGRFGKALVFDGDHALVSIKDSPALALTTAMTLEAWVFPTVTPTGWRDVVYKEDDTYYLEGSCLQTGTPTMGGTFNPSPLTAPDRLPINVWSHLACTYDGVVMRLYVNGVQVASRPLNSLIRTSTGPLTIGGDEIYGQFWTGGIDEVRVYARALSGPEIQADMNTPVGSDRKPLAMARAAPSSGQVPLLVSFSSAGSVDPEGATLTYSWDFGDGALSTAANPSHTYHAAGTFIAKLTVSDAANSVTSSNLTITVTNPPVNSLPTVSHLGGFVTLEDVPLGPIPFIIGDAETAAEALTLSGRSSDPTLVPDENIVFGGTGSNRTVRVIPASNMSGNVNITITVSDGTLVASDSFGLTISPDNDPPFASAIADQVTAEGRPIGPLPWTVFDLETDPGLLIISGFSSNPTLIADQGILFGGSGSNRTVTLVPIANQRGATTITLDVSDAELHATTRFDVTVRAIQFRISIVDRSKDGVVLLQVSGSAGGRYLLEVSPNLIDWTPLQVLSDPSGVSHYSDDDAASQLTRFYRIQASP